MMKVWDQRYNFNKTKLTLKFSTRKHKLGRIFSVIIVIIVICHIIICTVKCSYIHKIFSLLSQEQMTSLCHCTLHSVSQALSAPHTQKIHERLMAEKHTIFDLFLSLFLNTKESSLALLYTTTIRYHDKCNKQVQYSFIQHTVTYYRYSRLTHTTTKHF